MPQAKLVPLKDAPWAFASQRLRDEWQQAQDAGSSSKTSQSNSPSPELIKKLASENPAEAFKIVADSVGNIVEGIKVRSAPELAMQESLLEKLRDGKLEAWGVESAPQRKRELEMLASHFFMDAKISWNRNTVTSLGTTYSAVQVRRPSVVDAGRSRLEALSTFPTAPASTFAKPPPALPEDGSRRKPGPPSAAEEVIAAYDRMLQKGEIKKGMTVKAIYQRLLPVLARNSTMFPNGRGLAYSSIARHLRQHLTTPLKFSS